MKQEYATLKSEKIIGVLSHPAPQSQTLVYYTFITIMAFWFSTDLQSSSPPPPFLCMYVCVDIYIYMRMKPPPSIE